MYSNNHIIHVYNIVLLLKYKMSFKSSICFTNVYRSKVGLLYIIILCFQFLFLFLFQYLILKLATHSCVKIIDIYMIDIPVHVLYKILCSNLC